MNEMAGIINIQTADCLTKGLMLSQKLSADPDLLEDSITVMKLFLRDLFVFQFNREKIVNLDFSDVFTDISKRIEIKRIGLWIKELYETEKRLTANSSLRLTLDRFFLKMVIQKGKLVYD